MAKGKVFLIGAGSGDPSLITVRGAEVLSQCDAVVYDTFVHSALLLQLHPGTEVHAAGMQGGAENSSQEQIELLLLRLAQEGKTVGRLYLGDPLGEACGVSEALMLAARAISFEIIPGVPAPVAAAAYAGVPLMRSGPSSSVYFCKGAACDESVPTTQDVTLCALLDAREIGALAAGWIQQGRSQQASTFVIQNWTLPEQQSLVAPLGEIADRVVQEGFHGSTLVIVGRGVELRERLRWFDVRPLFGKRIWVTRAQEQASIFSRKLREVGAAPMEVPVLVFRPPPEPELLLKSAREVGSYDWLAFTSVNSVERFFWALSSQGLDARMLGGVRVAVIGPGTATALQQYGIRADCMPQEYRGEALASAILESPRPVNRQGPWPRVLLPRALVARDILPEMIRTAGGQVDVVPAYETCLPDGSLQGKWVDQLRTRSIDMITLTSSSTVTHLLELLGEDAHSLLEGVTLASIGPITTATAEKAGLHVKITATTFTLDGLIEAMEQAMSSY